MTHFPFHHVAILSRPGRSKRYKTKKKPPKEMLADKINYSERTWITSSRDGKFCIAASSLDLRRLNGTLWGLI